MYLRQSYPASKPNNSFKPNLLRYSKSVTEKACHAFASTTQVGLTQALGLQEQSQQSPGRAQAAAATCITHHATAIARSVGAKLTCIELQTAFSLAPRSRSRSTARKRWQSKSKRHTSDGLPDFVIQIGCQACALRSSEQEHRPNNSFKPSPLRGLGAKPVRLGRAGLTQALDCALNTCAP